MSNDEVIKNWIKLSEYDIKTALAMLDSRRYLYVVFTCQQSLEKILKALYIKEKEETPPYTHNLIRLMEKTSLYQQLSDKDIFFIEEINSYYLETRYTEFITKVSRSLNKKKATSIYSKTKDFYKWIREKI